MYSVFCYKRHSLLKVLLYTFYIIYAVTSWEIISGWWIRSRSVFIYSYTATYDQKKKLVLWKKNALSWEFNLSSVRRIVNNERGSGTCTNCTVFMFQSQLRLSGGVIFSQRPVLTYPGHSCPFRGHNKTICSSLSANQKSSTGLNFIRVCLRQNYLITAIHVEAWRGNSSIIKVIISRLPNILSKLSYLL